MKRAQISLVTFDLLAAKAQDEAISAVIAYEKEILLVIVKKAAQAARLHTVNALINRNASGAIRRLAAKIVLSSAWKQIRHLPRKYCRKTAAFLVSPDFTMKR